MTEQASAPHITVTVDQCSCEPPCASHTLTVEEVPAVINALGPESLLLLLGFFTRLSYTPGAPAYFNGGDPYARFVQMGMSEQWSESFTTAAAGSWYDGGPARLTTEALPPLLHETTVIHRQLTPLWRRQTRGRRVALLETPHNGVTLRDVLAGSECADDPLLARIPADKRLVAILDELDPQQREVVLALGLPGIQTWADAAEYAGAADPKRYGDKVRVRVRYLVRERQRREALRGAGARP
ncbi:hypothetical protein LG634_22990 [Streptomyces bambusae]|uniref:hypothetical protein n=1 Tax=Streptomyces bambusae TaxID=1550616 RepID=UPI001CFC886F|nr:hypothetical protein [Streptomyces bambusae]MCB5167684.1 hypothetical protein [Streptomyces bambusae]